MPDALTRLVRRITRADRREAADNTRVLAALRGRHTELTAHTVGVYAGLAPGKANIVLGRLVAAGRVDVRSVDGPAGVRVVYRLVEVPDVES